jgi:uncharacterized membrane protein required for colicin V production
MTEGDILDLLLAGIVLLMALIGTWQGVVRMLMAGFGALLGSELGLWWSDNAGDWLARPLPISEPSARFAAAAIAIVGMAVALMTLLGRTVMTATPRGSWRERIGGAVAGVAVAVLMLGLIVRYFHLHQFEQAEAAFDGTRIAARLWTQAEWVALGVTLIILVLAVVFWVLGPDTGSLGIASRVSPLTAWNESSRVSSMRSNDGSRQTTAWSASRPSSSWEAATAGTAEASSAGMASDTSGDAASGVSSAPAGAAVDIESQSETAHQEEAQDWNGFGRPMRWSDDSEDPDDDARTKRSDDGVSGNDHKRAEGRLCPNCGALITTDDQYCAECGNPVF